MSHDPSEIILICRFAAQETFLIIINVENSCAAEYLCVCVCFFQDSLMNRNFKRTALVETENFTLIFDQFNASLLNKIRISFKKKKLYTVKTFTQKYSAQLLFFFYIHIWVILQKHPLLVWQDVLKCISFLTFKLGPHY